MRAFLLVVALLVLLPARALPPASYAGAEINGRVVDAAGGQPLAGAVVVATWWVYRFNAPLANDGVLCFYVAEAVSDAQGRYRIPAWGPIPRPSGSQMDPLGGDDPILQAFKPGYEPEGFQNYAPESRWQGGVPFNPPDAELRRSVLDGKDLALYRYGTIDRHKGVSDPSANRKPETELRDRLKGFANGLEDHVRLADDLDAPDDSPRRLRFMERQRKAFLLMDDAIRQLTNKPYMWSHGIGEFIREQKRSGGQQ